MACRFKFIVVLVCLPAIASGCLSLRIEKAVLDTMPGSADELKVNISTLQDALIVCGAPADVIDVEGRTVLIYERGFYTGTQLSLGIPVSKYAGPDLNVSGYGRLWRYDRLALFFSPDWILTRRDYVKGSEDPFLSTLFRDGQSEREQIKEREERPGVGLEP